MTASISAAGMISEKRMAPWASRSKPVPARTLTIADALRQRAGLVERVVNDRAVPDLRPDTTVTGPMQRIQQCLKPGAWEKTRLHARLVGLP